MNSWFAWGIYRNMSLLSFVGNYVTGGIKRLNDKNKNKSQIILFEVFNLNLRKLLKDSVIIVHED